MSIFGEFSENEIEPDQLSGGQDTLLYSRMEERENVPPD
jgi:hypothetical protein